MISETDRRKINKILKQIKNLKDQHRRILYTDIDNDRESFHKIDLLSRLTIEIHNLKADEYCLAHNTE